MDPKIEKEILRLSKENNRLLKIANRRANFSIILFWLRWGLIIVVLVYAYMFAKPYFDQIMDTYQSFTNTISVGTQGISDMVGGVTDFIRRPFVAE